MNKKFRKLLSATFCIISILSVNMMAYAADSQFSNLV